MSQITILNQANTPMGPFTREQVAEKLQSGEFTLDSLAHVEGLSQWRPLREVLAKVDAVPPPAPPAGQIPPVIGAQPASPPAYSYAATMSPPSHLLYGGFWLRFVAYFLDSLIVGAVLVVMEIIVGILFGIIGGMLGVGMKDFTGANSGNPSPMAMVLIAIAYLIILALALVGTWLYFAKLESGPAQATYGKRVMGLRVTGLDGERIGFGRASGRFFGKIVSGMTFYIGFIMAGFTERKQALHDMIAGTLVVKQ